MNSLRKLIIIPAFNESASIEGVLHSLFATNPNWDLLLINDCSQDDTSTIAAAFKRAVIIDLPCNLGIGGTVQTGLIYADRKHYDIAVKFDGDGQHKATEIPNLIAPILKGEADVTIGSRFCSANAGYSSTYPRRVGIKIFEIFSSILIGQRITDNTSGFRAYNKEAISFLAKHYPSFDYPEPEEVILLGCNNFRFREVPTEMRERQGGKSSISPLKAVYYMIKVLLSVLMVRLRPPISR